MTQPNPARLRIDLNRRAELLKRVGPVVDSHVHQWDLDKNRYPWLQESPVKAHFGDYSAIRRNYLPDDFNADVAEVDVVARVHIEAHWQGYEDPAGETRWLTNLPGGPNGIVGHVDFLKDNSPDVLSAHLKSPKFRGVRMMTMRATAPSGVDLLEDQSFQTGLRKIAEHGLVFDLQARFDMLPAAAELARKIPELTFALTHAGLPIDRSDEGLSIWRSGIADIATAPNVVCKLSGLPMSDRTWSSDSIANMVQPVFDAFGPDRMCYGSNFPVDGLFARYPDVLATHIAALENHSDADLQSIFHHTAKRLYHL